MEGEIRESLVLYPALERNDPDRSFDQMRAAPKLRPLPLIILSAESGRTEARTGLRMMPTSPRSPLSFRTAGFPQYGWKAGLSSGAFPSPSQVKPAPGIR